MIAALDPIRHAGEQLLKRTAKPSGFDAGLWLPDRMQDFFGLRQERTEPADVLKGAAAGMVGGLIASWAMNQFHSLSSSAGGKLSSLYRSARSGDSGNGGPPKPPRGEQGKRATDSEDEDEPATTKTAQVVSKRVFQHDLHGREKQVAGPAVHYGYGTAMGGLYGGLVEAFPAVGAGFGTAYGAALWLGADEIAIPALGLGKSPKKTSFSEHAGALAAHLVYGMTTEAVRRLVRSTL